MIACAVRLRAFFRGETLNEDTPILVPDAGDLAVPSACSSSCQCREIARLSKTPLRDGCT
jgi:hypothetical protein